MPVGYYERLLIERSTYNINGGYYGRYFTNHYNRHIHNINVSQNFIVFLLNIIDNYPDNIMIRNLYYYMINDGYNLSIGEIENINNIFYNVKKINESKDGYILINNNQKIKLGKILNKLFHICYNDVSYYKRQFLQIEKIINEYKSWFVDKNKFNFKLLNGIDILEGYKYKNQIRNRSTLGNSCMNNKINLLDIYTENNDKVSLLVLYGFNNMILGRALIWKLKNRDELFMDRIYYADEYIRNLFINYAKNNKMIYRSGDAYDVFTIFLPEKDKYISKESNKVKLKVKLKTRGIKKYPYMDSLYLKRRRSFSTNIKYYFLSFYMELKSTRGNKKIKFKIV